MKPTTRFFLMLAVAAATLPASVPAAAQGGEAVAKLGQPAPDFTLIDSKGQQRTLSGHKGRIIVLEWINPECPYVENCYKSKAMQKTYDRVKALAKDVAWLAINSTSHTGASQNNLWIEKFDLKYPILLDTDGDVGRLYDARRTPHMYVIDREGVLRYHGAIDNDPFRNKSEAELVNYVADAVRQIVEGETVTPDHVKPYGCSVKYKPRRK